MIYEIHEFSDQGFPKPGMQADYGPKVTFCGLKSETKAFIRGGETNRTI